eukprot:TRINITY_DN7329_c0_g1_i2.p1 TRINITY_DN7329_c0_g1~~TRINITY_DN7329_c0_g1_i2.p1  ORF type:complete len:650 (+),score=122.71 TRINITY_DN7329_c0_g1_i2:136-2085(+)
MRHMMRSLSPPEGLPPQRTASTHAMPQSGPCASPQRGPSGGVRQPQQQQQQQHSVSPVRQMPASPVAGRPPLLGAAGGRTASPLMMPGRHATPRENGCRLAGATSVNAPSSWQTDSQGSTRAPASSSSLQPKAAARVVSPVSGGIPARRRDTDEISEIGSVVSAATRRPPDAQHRTVSPVAGSGGLTRIGPRSSGGAVSPIAQAGRTASPVAGNGVQNLRPPASASHPSLGLAAQPRNRGDAAGQDGKAPDGSQRRVWTPDMRGRDPSDASIQKRLLGAGAREESPAEWAAKVMGGRSPSQSAAERQSGRGSSIMMPTTQSLDAAVAPQLGILSKDSASESHAAETQSVVSVRTGLSSLPPSERPKSQINASSSTAHSALEEDAEDLRELRYRVQALEKKKRSLEEQLDADGARFLQALKRLEAEIGRLTTANRALTDGRHALLQAMGEQAAHLRVDPDLVARHQDLVAQVQAKQKSSREHQCEEAMSDAAKMQLFALKKAVAEQDIRFRRLWREAENDHKNSLTAASDECEEFESRREKLTRDKDALQWNLQKALVRSQAMADNLSVDQNDNEQLQKARKECEALKDEVTDKEGQEFLLKNQLLIRDRKLKIVDMENAMLKNELEFHRKGGVKKPSKEQEAAAVNAPT